MGAKLKKISTPSPKIEAKRVKLILVGDAGVGKTSLIMRFARNTFTEEVLPIRAFQLNRTIKKDEQEIDVFICTPHKPFGYNSLIYRATNVALICFDVKNKQSWCNVRKWIMEVERYTETDCLMTIVGCKADYLASPSPLPFVPSTKKNKNLTPIFHYGIKTPFYVHLISCPIYHHF